MVGPKPVRPSTAKSSFEKPTEGKISKKPKKPVAKSVTKSKSETKAVSKTPAKTPSKKNKDAEKTDPEPSTEAVSITDEQIESGVKAFKKFLGIREEEDGNKDLFSSEGKKVSLQISGIKVPRETEKQNIKMRLPHSPLPPRPDICLFVKDLQKGLKVDHEDTIRHFTDLLAEKGVKGVTQIISLRELKVEYKQFEAKIQLSNKFDLFLADDRIIRLLPKFLGKPFYSRKKLPLQINLQAKDLSKEMVRCLNTTQLPMTHTGSCSMVTVGSTITEDSELTANIKSVMETLATKYPGGLKNIRSVNIFSGTSSLPIYATSRATKEVGHVSGAKPKKRDNVTDELSTVVGGEVTVTPYGGVIVKRKADPDWTEEDETLEKLPKKEGKGDDDEEEEEQSQEDEKKDGEEAEKPVEKKKAKGKKGKKDDSDSEDDMEDQELEYMKKVAEEEEEMERKLEDNDAKISNQLQVKDDEDEEEEDVDDDEEAENLLSEGDDSDEEDNIMMKKTLKEVNEEIDADPPEKIKNKKAEKVKKQKASKKADKSSPSASSSKPLKGKDKKQQKFIEKKKKEKSKKK